MTCIMILNLISVFATIFFYHRQSTIFLIIIQILFFFISGIGYNVTCAVFCALSYHRLLEFLVSSCPLSFTYGEATVTTQATLLFVVSSVTNMLVLFRLQSCFDVFTLILQVSDFECHYVCKIILQPLIFDVVLKRRDCGRD